MGCPGRRKHTVCDGRTILFCLLGDPASEWEVLVWELSANLSDVNRANALVYTDFLVRQLQSGCSWFSRLDKTQALLYRDDLTGLFNSRYLDISLEIINLNLSMAFLRFQNILYSHLGVRFTTQLSLRILCTDDASLCVSVSLLFLNSCTQPTKTKNFPFVWMDPCHLQF